MIRSHVMARVINRRSFLIGMLTGAAFAIASAGVAAWYPDEPETQYLRVIDDNFDYLLGPNHEPKDGTMSGKIIRDCKIENFVFDVGGMDAAASSFVKIDGMPKANLNCLIGEARINSMSIAITDGIDTTPTDCLGGWPTRFKNREAGDFQLCRGKNPNPIFVSSPAPKR